MLFVFILRFQGWLSPIQWKCSDICIHELTDYVCMETLFLVTIMRVLITYRSSAFCFVFLIWHLLITSVRSIWISCFFFQSETVDPAWTQSGRRMEIITDYLLFSIWLNWFELHKSKMHRTKWKVYSDLGLFFPSVLSCSNLILRQQPVFSFSLNSFNDLVEIRFEISIPN